MALPVDLNSKTSRLCVSRKSRPSRPGWLLGSQATDGSTGAAAAAAERAEEAEETTYAAAAAAAGRAERLLLAHALHSTAADLLQLQEQCRAGAGQMRRLHYQVAATEDRWPAPAAAEEGRQETCSEVTASHGEEEQARCKVCLVGPIVCMIYPCGHCIACDPCLARLESCPVCRADKQLLIRLRWS